MATTTDLTIEAGGLDALDPDRVVEVLCALRDNAHQCRKWSGIHGLSAAEDFQRGWNASGQMSASIAIRYARIALAYQDAMLWIMAATAKTSFSLAVPDLPPSDVSQ